MTTAEASPSVLVNRSVKRTLFGMAFPMLAGTFAMNAYSLTDTWFVSRLGTGALAAMGFSFPVIMLLTCVAGGIGNGAMTLVSHAIGRREQHTAATLVTHGLTLIFLVSATMSVLGYLTIDLVFRRLGADAPTRALVGQYMRVWYLGALFMAIPMIGNGILISTGDSRLAGRVMMTGPILNVILDPIMIFGWAGFPAMGLKGAALATVLSQLAASMWALYAIYAKHRLIELGRHMMEGWPATIRRILGFAIPGMLSMMLMPISAGVITRLLGHFGSEAVAAAGAAGRLEMFAFVVPMALGISLTPFVSQNFGAGRIDRIREAHAFGIRFALLYGGAVAVVFFLFAPGLAGIFSSDPKVLEVLVSYIRIIAFGYGMMEVHRYCGFVLNGLHKPVFSTLLNAIRVLVLLVPLAMLGAHLGGVRGLFWGRLATDITAGTIGLVWVRHMLKSATRTG